MLPTLQQVQLQSQRAPTRLLLDVESGTTVAVFNVAGVANAADAVIYKGRSEFSLVKMAGATTGQIAVLFPDIGEPYRSVFTKIIEGIEEKAKGRVLSVPVGNNVNPTELATELRKQDVKVVVGLGRQGQKAAVSVNGELNVVVGGVLAVPEADAQLMPVHTLAPDPNLLFRKLKSLAPNVRKVHVVYDPRQNAWLIKLAREAARVNGLELLAQEATDLRTAVRAYQGIINSPNLAHEALWLLQDSTTVDESVILPLVLEDGWGKNLLVFSSNMAHVKRGALFSLYPSNVDLGRTLGASAMSYLGGGNTVRGVLPLTDVLMAVNLRTATHLGISLNYTQQRAFDSVYPQP
ncbi:MAG: hypothetical protein RL210_2116 [Pseudomonadota bacterium]